MATIDLNSLALSNVPYIDQYIFQWAQEQLNNEQKFQQFQFQYMSQKKQKDTCLLLAVISFIGISGIHRFYCGDIGMGVAYLLTGGFCLIGTIVDLFNMNKIVNQANVKVAYETMQMVNFTPYNNPNSNQPPYGR